MNGIVNPAQQDNEHIKLLSVFHYVMGGLAILGILFLCLHYFIFRTVIDHAGFGSETQGFLGIFVWFYLLIGLVFLAVAVGNFLSAGYMRQRKNRAFSLIVAGINCLQVPMGTMLGIFTIIVLMRDTVAQSYDKQT